MDLLCVEFKLYKMARIHNNIFTQGIKGMVGGTMVFRTFNDKTYVYAKAGKPDKRKQSPLQKENRTKFRRATAFAKSMMKDPAKKAEYWEIAKKLALPNAYTAAITEYMRKPEVIGQNTTTTTGTTKEEISVIVKKKHFEVDWVEVVITEKDGKVLERGRLLNEYGDTWNYKPLVSPGIHNFKNVSIIVGERTGLVTSFFFNGKGFEASGKSMHSLF